MRACEQAVNGIVLVKPGVKLEGTRGVTPVSHQIANDGEERYNIDTGTKHLVVGDVANLEEVSGVSLGEGIVQLTSLVVVPDASISAQTE